MCLSLRNTDRRGLSDEPNRLLRMPNLRRSRRFCLSRCLSAISVARASSPCPTVVFINTGKMPVPLLRPGAGERLARLDLHDLALVPDALALVRLGLSHAAERCGELADALLVGAAHVDLCRA